MRALVMSGGGSKGAHSVGVIKYLINDKNLEYDLYSGISVGAINALHLSQYKTGYSKQAIIDLEKFWLLLEDKKVKQVWSEFKWLSNIWEPLGFISSVFKPSIYDSSPLREFITKNVDLQSIKTSGKLLRLVSVGWDTGETITVTEETDNMIDWVLASSAFPVMLTPIKINNQEWCDGGLRMQTPLGAAIKAGATEIDVILTSNPYSESLWGSSGQAAIPGRLFRALDIMSDEIMRADLKVCGLKNDLSELKPQYKKIKINIYQPSKPMMFDSLTFDPLNIRDSIQLGYDDAKSLDLECM